ETSRTAASPPKLRPSAVVASSASGVGGDSAMRQALRGGLPSLLRRSRQEPPPLAREPKTAQSFRQNEHHKQNDETFHEQLAFGHDLGNLAESRQRECTEDRTVQGV